MIMGGVNEGTLPSSAMVRVADVVNSETETIHQQLAGGLTVANLLHGSANPIGGQNCVLKLREVASPEQLKLAVAPGGIKFALGEIVKQANWGEDFKNRFPQSRLGVIPLEMGGGLGGKITVHLEPVAARLAPLSGRPVKMSIPRSNVLEGRTGPARGRRRR